MTNRTLVLTSRPHGALRASDFAILDKDIPAIQDGQVLVRNLFGSLDPGTRKLFGEADGYIEPIPVGSPVGCLVLGQVQESRDTKFAKGSLIVGTGALQEYSVIQPGPMTWTVDPHLSTRISNHMSVLGSAGLTAYFGLLDVGQPKPGQTLLVSAAAGAVGSLVGQIGKIKGCRVVGIAGGAEKCARLTQDFGFDASIDYRGKSQAELASAVSAAAPTGVDIYFDNVGGAQLDAALASMNWSGRVVECGMISEYDGGNPPVMQNLFRIVGKVLTVRGFLIFTYADQFPAAIAELAAWTRSGRLHMREQIEDGLANAIPGFLKLFSGGNDGKAMVKIAEI